MASKGQSPKAHSHSSEIQLSLSRSLLMSSENDDSLNDVDNYEDSRLELRATSHNLTSVLINPRESLLENFLDDFATDQSAPLELLPTIPSTPPPTNEMDQLRKLVSRLSKSHSQYLSTHAAISSNTSKPLLISKTPITDDVTLCFREVPPIFFHPDFSLQDPHTFDIVFGSIPVELQDRLSIYLDLVELALLRLIWSRSPSFFRALDDIKGLETRISDATRRTISLRHNLLSFDNVVAVASMRIPRLQQRRQNQMKVQDILLSMQAVMQGRSVIQNLIQSEDYLGAMEVVTSMKRLLTEDLHGVNCMKGIAHQLTQFDDHIRTIMCTKFVKLAVEWSEIDGTGSNTSITTPTHTPRGVRSSVNNNEDDELLAGSSSSGSASLLKEAENRGTFQLLVKVLLDSGRLSSAIQLYKTRLNESIRLIIRTCILEYLSGFDPSSGSFELGMDNELPSSSTSSSSSNTEAETPFAQRIKGMSNENFLSCMSMCFEHLLLALTRSKVVHEHIVEVITGVSYKDLDTNELQHMDGDDTINTSTNNTNTTTITSITTSNIPNKQSQSQTHVLSVAETELITLSKSCVITSCDLAQRTVSQILSLRKDSNARLTVDKIKFLWETSLFFILSLERLTLSTAYILRQCLVSQSKVFLEYLSENLKGRLINALDAEKWTQCDVTLDRQKELDRLVSAKSKEPRPARVDNSQFRVVWSVMLLLELVLTFLGIAVDFSPVTTEVIAKTVEILKLFDTRTRQLVLGAQAIQSAARLKSISAKHLCVTAQSLGLVLAVLPHLRAALLAQLPPKHHVLLTELDRVSQHIVEHQNQILSKFVTIVNDFVEASADKLSAIDWDRFQGQCEYFDDVLRNVTTLHRVLCATLPAEQVQDVFSRIFALLNRKVPQHFESIMPSTQTGRQRILDEVVHLVNACSVLKQVDASSISLEDSFRTKFGR
eukprot:gene5065-10139_t